MQLSSVAILTLAFPKTKEILHQALLFWRRIRVIRTSLHGTALTAAMEVMVATAAIVLTLPIHRITQVIELTYSSCNNRAYGGHTIVASVFLFLFEVAAPPPRFRESSLRSRPEGFNS